MGKTESGKSSEGASSKKELRFGPGMMSMIESGMKMTSLRWPSGGRDFARGEIVRAKEGDKEMDVVVVGCREMEIARISDLVLLSDGFLDCEEAARRMSEIYGRGEAGFIDETEEVAVVAFMPVGEFEKLDELTRRIILDLEIDRLFTDPRTRRYFLPVAGYMAGLRELSINQWLDILIANGIFGQGERQIVEAYSIEGSYDSEAHMGDDYSDRSRLAELWWIGEGPLYEGLFRGELGDR